MANIGRCVPNIEISFSYGKSASLISTRDVGIMTSSSQTDVDVNYCIRNCIIA